MDRSPAQESSPPPYSPSPPAPAEPSPSMLDIDNVDKRSGSPCPTCGRLTGNIPRKKTGYVTILWCFCLFFFTGGVGWCYPFCIDSCKDTELVCVKCQSVKSRIPATCC